MNWHFSAPRLTREQAQEARGEAARAGYNTTSVFQDGNSGNWYFQFGEDD